MSVQINAPAYVQHPKLIAWVQEIADLCKPESVYCAMAAKPNMTACAPKWLPLEP